MFIRAANSRLGTGYTIDVNNAFRQGRQDAYRDYIDNYNFALAADAARNAENQRNVQRVAQNYGLSNQMDHAARANAYDFLTGSQKISDAAFNFDVNQNRLGSLYPQAPALGQAQAQTQVNNTAAQQTASAYKAGQAEYRFDNLPQEATNYGSTLRNQGAALDNAATVNNMTSQGLDVTQGLAQLSGLSPEQWERNFTTEVVRQYRANTGDNTRTDADIIADLRRTRQYDVAYQEYQNDQYRTLQNQANAYNRNVNAVAAPGSRQANQTTTRQSAPKQNSNRIDQVKLGERKVLSRDDLSRYTGGNVVGTTQDGLEVVQLPTGDILLRGDRGGYFIGASTLNGARRNFDDTLADQGIRVNPIPAIRKSTE